MEIGRHTQKIIKGERETPATTESNIPKAYEFFRKELGRKLDSKEIMAEHFFIVLSNCFQVVVIDLNKDESPYKIFESLNAKGKPLEQADLVRNYIAMKLPTAQQEKVFTDQWEKIETLLQEKRTVGKSGLGELTAFMRHYLAMRSRVLCSEEHIYARFRDRCEKLTDSDFIEELSTLRRFAEYYDKLLRPQNEKNQKIQDALHRLNTLELSTAYPFLLSVYDAYDSNQISYADFAEALNLMENYMVRRFICGTPTRDITRLFPTLWRDITNEMASEASFKEALINVLVSKKYPSNRSVVQSIRTAKLYDNRSQSKIVFVLETVNRHLSLGTGGFTVLDSKPTIEHILPQKPSETWKNELGENLDSIYQDYLHTLGNLTLVTAEWNSIISNSPFQNKKQHFARHALRINSDYFSHDIQRWDEQAILERADFIAQNFLKIWPAIGESAPLETQPYSKPKAITICGETIAIPKNTWRELIKLTAEWVIKNRPERFEVARQKLASYFGASISGKNSPTDWHQLSNGIWLYQNGSAKAHVSFCRRLLAAVGISESEWNIEEVNAATPTNSADP